MKIKIKDIDDIFDFIVGTSALSENSTAILIEYVGKLERDREVLKRMKVAVPDLYKSITEGRHGKVKRGN